MIRLDGIHEIGRVLPAELRGEGTASRELFLVQCELSWIEDPELAELRSEVDAAIVESLLRNLLGCVRRVNRDGPTDDRAREEHKRWNEMTRSHMRLFGARYLAKRLPSRYPGPGDFAVLSDEGLREEVLAVWNDHRAWAAPPALRSSPRGDDDPLMFSWSAGVPIPYENVYVA